MKWTEREVSKLDPPPLSFMIFLFPLPFLLPLLILSQVQMSKPSRGGQRVAHILPSLEEDPNRPKEGADLQLELHRRWVGQKHWDALLVQGTRVGWGGCFCSPSPFASPLLPHLPLVLLISDFFEYLILPTSTPPMRPCMQGQKARE